MARLWAYILKENNGYANKATVKAPTGKYTAVANQQTIDGVKNTDYIIPDVENQSFEIADTNNSYAISSYASFGGTRLNEVVGYQVAGNWSTKLYEEQASFLLDLALRKRNATTNPTGDLPSFRADIGFYDSDYTPNAIGNVYQGLKIGQFGISTGVTNPYVQCSAQMVGSRVFDVPSSGNPTALTYAQEPECDSYPINPFTFRHCSVYVDFNGGTLFADKTGHWDVASLASKKLTVLRSVGLNFSNQLATTSHTDGIVERIIRTMVQPSFSIVVDMMDPGVTDSSTPKSRIWQDKYRSMRAAAANGYFSVAVVFDNGSKQVIFDLGKQACIVSKQDVKSMTEVFAVQISGNAMFDSSMCGTFDWTVQNSTVSS